MASRRICVDVHRFPRLRETFSERSSSMAMAGVICILVLLVVCPCRAITADGHALLAFLQNVKGSRDALQDWNPSDLNPCSWTGIGCSSNGRVVNISLSQMDLQGSIPSQFGSLSSLRNLFLPSTNLTGSIPKELGNCSSVEVIDFSGNNLTGSIPPEFGRLKNLTQLYLESNHFYGSIPPELGGCSSLRTLTLHDNHLRGPIPRELGLLGDLEVLRAGGNPLLTGILPPELARCKKLVSLGLAVTSISGSIPREFGELSNLSILSLYQTNLSGPMPPELGNCSQLEDLYLYDNHLSGPVPKELRKLQLLSSFLLWQNDLVGPIPPELGGLQSLQQLDLSQNSLTGAIPATLGNLTALKQLYLSLNLLSGSIPSELGDCSSLVDLQLDRNRLSGTIPGQLGKLAQLSQILLWNNSLEGAIPAGIGNCSRLQSLDFSWNKLTGAIPVELFYLQTLQKLLLLSNSLSGEISSAIGQCRGLHRLRLGNNSLTGYIPKELGQLQDLSFLDISNNQFSGGFPTQISTCRALQLLDIYGNQLNGSIPKQLGRLANLQVLDASMNRFTGSIPEELGNLALLSKLSFQANSLSGNIPNRLVGCKRLEWLDLSRNSLSGTIPPVLGQMKTLTIVLNLSSNNLFGSIPEEFSGLTNLGALDLSHNMLSGSLDVLAKLGNLVTLNISFNDFSGSLPDTYLFRSLPANDYMGNIGLCSTSSKDVSCFLNDSRVSNTNGGEFPKAKLIACFLFGSAAIMIAVGFFLVYIMGKSNQSPMDDSESSWPWQLTAFQKLSFSIEDVLERLDEANVIGKGCSGVVYRADMPGGEVIAVKKVLSSSKEGHHRDVFAAEIRTLGAIRHLNIVRLLGYCSNHETKLLMYDYMPNGSLGEALHEKKKMLDWETRYKIVLGAAQGLAYLHHDCVPPILHRDVKPNNILLGPRFEPYLADFGLAKIVDSPDAMQTTLAGSYGYIAPEYGYTLNITDKSDVYSYGVVLLEVLTGRKPVDPTSCASTRGAGGGMEEGKEDRAMHLTEWVAEMRGRYQDMVEVLDPRLQGMPDPYIHEMIQALWIALDCVHPLPEERPTMRHVASLLVELKHEFEDYANIDALLQKHPHKTTTSPTLPFCPHALSSSSSYPSPPPHAHGHA